MDFTISILNSTNPAANENQPLEVKHGRQTCRSLVSLLAHRFQLSGIGNGSSCSSVARIYPVEEQNHLSLAKTIFFWSDFAAHLQ